MRSTASTASTGRIIDERSDILELLRTRRFFLINAARGLTDEQAASTPTVSALCIGGLIKHVARTESGWLDYIVSGPSAPPEELRRAVSRSGAGKRSSSARSARNMRRAWSSSAPIAESSSGA